MAAKYYVTGENLQDLDYIHFRITEDIFCG